MLASLKETSLYQYIYSRYSSLLLMAFDVVAINSAYGIALWFRFDCHIDEIPDYFMMGWLQAAPIFTLITIALFVLLHLYSSIWRFAGSDELMRALLACLVSLGVQTGITCLLMSGGREAVRMPISFYIVGALLEIILVVGARICYRTMLRLKSYFSMDTLETKNVMVIGAGEAGRMVIYEMNHSDHVNGHVRCIIDDDTSKRGRYLNGVPVVGGRRSILQAVSRYKINQIIFAIPTATPEEKKEILDICKEARCELKSLPGLYQMISGEVTLNDLRDVSLEDLLGRDPIQVNSEEILDYVQGKVVLVTGGGGSIGSELCRQIAGHNPRQLIIFDIYENNAYEIQQELRRSCVELNLLTLIGSVRDEGKLEQVFSTYKPDIVYHAAAHKHVPLMEDSPCEAIKNNVFGTYRTAMAAARHGCGKFVLISTDKAVNPTNIMGATKRLCEMIIQTIDKTSRTEFVAVRFGNVLGSNGSVIPLFRQQIAAGGPVTVTHRDIIRYFMTIPEAVGLVLQAGAYAKGGEIFVLDMGDPVRIDDLARNLIKLSGHTPDGDIEVRYTGLRPGEKLYEEKLMAEEGLRITPNKKILIGSPLKINEARFLEGLAELEQLCARNNDDFRETLSRLVPTYNPQK